MGRPLWSPRPVRRRLSEDRRAVGVVATLVRETYGTPGQVQARCAIYGNTWDVLLSLPARRMGNVARSMLPPNLIWRPPLLSPGTPFRAGRTVGGFTRDPNVWWSPNGQHVQGLIEGDSGIPSVLRGQTRPSPSLRELPRYPCRHPAARGTRRAGDATPARPPESVYMEQEVRCFRRNGTVIRSSRRLHEESRRGC